jgi:hypothetical protein
MARRRGPGLKTLSPGAPSVNDLRNELAFNSDVTERVLAAFETAGVESPRVPAGTETDTAE